MTAEGESPAHDDVTTLLAACTEAGRLKRAIKLADQVDFQFSDGELIIAAVANYNVVIDVSARRIQHGCRDFQGQAPTRHLCKHVAATVIGLGKPLSAQIAHELAQGAAATRSTARASAAGAEEDDSSTDSDDDGVNQQANAQRDLANSRSAAGSGSSAKVWRQVFTMLASRFDCFDQNQRVSCLQFLEVSKTLNCTDQLFWVRLCIVAVAAVHQCSHGHHPSRLS